jgi:CubicO group peptidase (beta-lactamase class C family)
MMAAGFETGFAAPLRVVHGRGMVARPLKEEPPMRLRPTAVLCAVVLSLAPASFTLSMAQPKKPAVTTASSTATVAAQSVGFSAERLDRVTKTMERYETEGRIAGAVTFVMRRGKVAQFEATGFADLEQKKPMRKDTIFRIASMSKAVTSVAAMILIEEGLLGLDTPVSRFFPSFKKTTVALRAPTGAVADSPVTIVPAKREINVRDLLTHTAGISYGRGPAAAMWKAAGIQDWYLTDRKETIADVVDRIAALPFDAQPGEAYVYGYNTDVLGAVVEKASGKPLDVFFKERIFEPLKMVDTAFFVAPEKRDRLATVYAAKPDGSIARAPEEGMGQGAYVDGPRMCFGGGAGLTSTAADYARLLQMMANGGKLDSVRILSPKTVELMTANHTGNLYLEGRTGFGLGFDVTEDVGRDGRYGSVGAYGWGSAYFSRYFIDPHEDLIAIFLAQLVPNGGLDLQYKFRTLVYTAIEESGR